MDIFTLIQKILNDEGVEYCILKKDKTIKLKAPANEVNFCAVVQKFTAEFGDPKYVDCYYGYIWSVNDKFLSFNVIETRHYIEDMYIVVFKRLPLSKRTDYKYYFQLDTAITEILRRYNFTCDNFIHYRFIGNEYLYFGRGAEYECIITLKRKCLNISVSAKQQLSENSYRPVLVFNKNFRINIKDIEAIRNTLSACLSSFVNSKAQSCLNNK